MGSFAGNAQYIYIFDISLKSSNLRLQLQLPGVNELMNGTASDGAYVLTIHALYITYWWINARKT